MDISSDGKVVVVASESHGDVEGLHAVHIFKGNQAITVDLGGIEKGSEVTIDPNGNYIIVINRNKNYLVFYDTIKSKKAEPNRIAAKDFSISADGRLVMVVTPDGKTILGSNGRSISEPLEGSWRIVGNNFLVRETPQGLANEAFLII